MAKEPKELKGTGGRDASAMKSDVGGAKMGGKKQDKLAEKCGECSGKDAQAYSKAKLQGV